jgi:RNA polymerase-interacting CarD/CdnL/TRCF family regulator
MAGYGVPELDIARVIGIDPKTLRKHYRDELATGHVKTNAKVAENLYRKATGEGREAVTAAISWLAADRNLARRIAPHLIRL